MGARHFGHCFFRAIGCESYKTTMSTENLEKFASILAAPVYLTTSDLKGDIKWRESGLKPRDSYDSDEESMPDLVGCDKCGADSLSHFFRSYTDDPALDLCIPCYKELRLAATPAETVKKAKAKWQEALRQCIAAGKASAKAESRARHARNISIWNLLNPNTPCPFDPVPESDSEESADHKDKRSKKD